MALQFQNSHRITIHLVRKCGLKLPWVSINTMPMKLFYTVYDILLLLIGIYQFIFYSTSIMKVNFQDMCTLGISTTLIATGILITFFFLGYQDRLLQVSNSMNALSQKMANTDGTKEFFLQLYHEEAEDNGSFTKKLLFTVFCTPFLYCLPVPVFDLYNHSYRAHHPLPTIYPYDYHQPGVWEFTFCLHLLGNLISTMKKFGNDCFFLALFKIQYAYIKTLQVSIRGLGKQFDTLDQDYFSKKLIIWIKLHQDTIKNAHSLVSLYAPIIVIYYVNLIVIVVCGLMMQLKNSDDSIVQSGTAGLFVAVNIFQLYIQCSVAEELNTQAEELALDIYNLCWYKMDRNNARLLSLVLLMANKPIPITAFRAPSFLLNKESFIKFITNTITGYMTFSKINDVMQ